MNTIERNIMAAVRVIYAIRVLTSRFAIKGYIFLVSVIGISTLVSLPHVLQNFSKVAGHGVSATSLFIFSAILGTKMVVQIATLIGLMALVAMCVDAVKSITTRQQVVL